MYWPNLLNDNDNHDDSDDKSIISTSSIVSEFVEQNHITRPLPDQKNTLTIRTRSHNRHLIPQIL